MKNTCNCPRVVSCSLSLYDMSYVTHYVASTSKLWISHPTNVNKFSFFAETLNSPLSLSGYYVIPYKTENFSNARCLFHEIPMVTEPSREGRMISPYHLYYGIPSFTCENVSLSFRRILFPSNTLPAAPNNLEYVE